MLFTLVIHSAPYSTQASSSAFRFAKSVLESDHEIYRLFFFGDGVHAANKNTVVQQDDCNWQHQWDELIKAHKLNSVVCVSSAIKRGVIDTAEAKRYEFDSSSIFESSEIAGLGQLIDASIQSDRTVSFG